MTLFGFDISGIISVLKVIGFILSLLLGVGTVLASIGKLRLDVKVRAQQRAHFIVHTEQKESPEKSRWDNIKQHLHSRNAAEWRIGIIDADTMLEDMITRMGYQGVNFGEKLKAINPAHFADLQSAWHVHKLRNVIAHQGSHTRVSERDIHEASKIYEDLFYNYGYFS